MNDFCIGDRVRILSYGILNGTDEVPPLGCVGEIILIDDDYLHVDIGGDAEDVNDDSVYPCLETEIELVKGVEQ